MELAPIIKQQSEVAREKLIQKSQQNTNEQSSPFQGLLFVGNRHETVPFRLLTDKYLTPRAKTAWQMIKLNAQQFQGAAFPSYEELGHWLSDRSFQGKQLSRKTISQTLLLLRLTRWLTLCETVRNEKGQILGNVYIMNDEPLSFNDCLHLNEDYLRLLEKSVKHADPLIQDVAKEMIKQVIDQKDISHFVSHLDVIRSRHNALEQHLSITTSATELPENLAIAIHQTQQKLLSSHKELGEEIKELSQKSTKLQSSNKELGVGNEAKSLILGLVPERNAEHIQYSTYNNSIKYCTGLSNLKLSPLEKSIVEQELAQLDFETQTAVLFEAQERIAKGHIKKPAGYLISLLRKAKSGDFKPYLLNKSVQSATEKTVDKPVHNAQNILYTIKAEASKSNIGSAYIQQLAQSLKQKNQ